jgi:DNA topoisomerase-1
VGYDLSGLIWKKVRYGLSAGRVQSPALRILMEREREIRAFVPETFYVITAQTQTRQKRRAYLTCAEEPRDKKACRQYYRRGKKDGLSVADVGETEAKRSPRPPFTTSTLQQAASAAWATRRATPCASRKSCTRRATLPTCAPTRPTWAPRRARRCSPLVEKKFGKSTPSPHTYATKSKNAQEAHEAIRPTHIEKESAGTTPEQKKLYELIWRRTIASQMADAKILRTKIEAKTKDKNVPAFAATGSRVCLTAGLRPTRPRAARMSSCPRFCGRGARG